MSTAYLIRWSGPVDESEDAYGDSYTPSGLTAKKHVQEVLYVPGGDADEHQVRADHLRRRRDLDPLG